MATSRAHKKKNDIFAKKIPVNPKYQHIKTTLDTGASASNYLNKIEEIKKNYRYRKDEIFKRMKVSTFAQLVLQVAEVCNLELERLDLETGSSDINVVANINGNENLMGNQTERSLLQDVVCGVGEIAVNSEESVSPRSNVPESKDEKLPISPPEVTSLPYLLLDVRDSDAYNDCHIIGSLNYPAAMLARSVNYLSKEMLIFKNKPGKIIIVYDVDEKISSNVATVLVQRDINNVIMLSGGMKVLNKKFPACFLTGKIPAGCFSPLLDRKGKLKAPPTVLENTSTNWYTSELLERIQDNLDDVLLSNESSRLSSRTSRSSKSTISNKSTSTSRTGGGSQATWR